MLAACDHFGGIDSHVPLANGPPTGCVARALTSGGATRIRYKHIDFPRSRSNPEAPTEYVDQWRYELSRQSGLRVEIYSGRYGLSYSNGIGLTEGAVPDARIDALRPLILQINGAVARECEIDLHDAGIQEIRVRDHRRPS